MSDNMENPFAWRVSGTNQLWQSSLTSNTIMAFFLEDKNQYRLLVRMGDQEMAFMLSIEAATTLANWLQTHASVKP